MSLLARTFSALNVLVYRASKGRVMGHFPGGAAICLLTTTGCKSGKPRTVPLLYLEDGDRLVVVASKAGAPAHPAWFYNLQARPRAEIQLRERRFSVTAAVASEADKAKFWPALVKLYPPYESYQRRTQRAIPLVILTPS